MNTNTNMNMDVNMNMNMNMDMNMNINMNMNMRENPRARESIHSYPPCRAESPHPKASAAQTLRSEVLRGAAGVRFSVKHRHSQVPSPNTALPLCAVCAHLCFRSFEAPLACLSP